MLHVISNLTSFSNKKSVYTTELASRRIFLFHLELHLSLHKQKQITTSFVSIPFEPQKLTYPCTSSANILVLYPELKCEIILPQFNFFDSEYLY